jgi:TolA-binding protein
MSRIWQSRSTPTGCGARWPAALGACLALAACAGTAPRADVATAAPVAAAAKPAAAGDATQRNRQFQRAEALYLSGHLPEATTAFEQLTRSYPQDVHVWLKYGNSLTRQGNYDDAVHAFQTALTLDPSQSGAAINLSLVRLAQAQGALDTALARAPAGSPEYLQAQSLQRAITTLLGAPHGVAAH